MIRLFREGHSIGEIVRKMTGQKGGRAFQRGHDEVLAIIRRQLPAGDEEKDADMPTLVDWETSACEREAVLRAYARRKRARSGVRARGAAAVFVIALLVAVVILAPSVLEVVVGAGLIALGLLWLAGRALPRHRHRWGLLGVLLAVVALVEARKPRR